MPWRDVALHLAALGLYPGLLFALLVGLALEIGAGWALVPERGGAGPAARSVLGALRPHPAWPPPLLPAGAAALALLAGAQLGAPFNPVPPGERNLVTAGVAVAATAWGALIWGWGRGGADPGLTLRVQLCWTVALFSPAIVPETLRPQALGAVLLPALLPVKIAAGLLFLLCLPVLLQLIPESAPQGIPGGPGRQSPGRAAAAFGAVRVLLWVPCCGLFASLFLPPGADDAGGLARFGLVTAGTAALAIGLASNLVRRSPRATQRFYSLLVLPLTLATVLLAAATALLRS